MAWRTSGIGMYLMASEADWKVLSFRPRSGGVHRSLSCSGARPRTIPASPTMTADCTLARRAAENGPNEAKSSSDEAKGPSYTGIMKINEKSARQENTKGAGDWGRHHCRTQGRWRPNRALIRHMQGAGPAQSGGLQGGKGGPALTLGASIRRPPDFSTWTMPPITGRPSSGFMCSAYGRWGGWRPRAVRKHCD
jgi:hypothetical protein